MADIDNAPVFSETEQRNMYYGLYTGKIRRSGITLQGYCILWDTKRDFQGEYFTDRTDIKNLDRSIPITILADGKFIDIGYVTLKRDEFGIFAVGKIGVDDQRQVQYIDAVNSLVDQDVAYFTTAATFVDYPEGTPHVDENGMITVWPIHSVHITTTPADPR